MRIQKIIKTRTGKELTLKNYRCKREGNSQPPVWTETTVLLPKK